MKHMLKCQSCGSYTFSEKCPNCAGAAIIPKPAKYSPEDKYAEYRRRAKEDDRKKAGQL